jgi:hypothetical protein
MEVRVEYKLLISNQFTAFENVDDCGEIYRFWKRIRESIKISGKSLDGRKQRKPWFYERCSKFVDKIK